MLILKLEKTLGNWKIVKVIQKDCYYDFRLQINKQDIQKNKIEWPKAQIRKVQGFRSWEHENYDSNISMFAYN